MTRPNASSIGEYFANQPALQRRILKRIRSDARVVIRGAEDVISYGIPALRRDGRIVVWYAGFAKHVSIFPMGPGILKAAKVDAATYKTSKGTIQFSLDRPPSSALVKRLVRARLSVMPAAAKK